MFISDIRNTKYVIDNNYMYIKTTAWQLIGVNNLVVFNVCCKMHNMRMHFSSISSVQIPTCVL